MSHGYYYLYVEWCEERGTAPMTNAEWSNP